MTTKTEILTKVYGFVNRLKIDLSLNPDTAKAFETLNELSEYLVSVDVSDEIETPPALLGHSQQD